MTSLPKKITAPLILLAALGGCTAFYEGPRFLWGAGVKRNASEMGLVCLGASGLGNIINPITWFLTPPDSYWFARANLATERNHSKGIWIVLLDIISYGKDPLTFVVLIDVKTERRALLGDFHATDSPKEILKSLDSPDWKNLDDIVHDVWTSNAIDWIKNGKPETANYCD